MAAPSGLQDFSSLARDWTCIPSAVKGWSPNPLDGQGIPPFFFNTSTFSLPLTCLLIKRFAFHPNLLLSVLWPKDSGNQVVRMKIRGMYYKQSWLCFFWLMQNCFWLLSRAPLLVLECLLGGWYWVTNCWGIIICLWSCVFCFPPLLEIMFLSHWNHFRFLLWSSG